MAILFTILGFLFWWPVGLAILFYMIGTGRMGCFGRQRNRGYYQTQGQGSYGQTWRGAGPWGNWRSWMCGSGNEMAGNAARPSSGNQAFDEYRAETLHRLEEEQQEFTAFLERLRFAKDKAEFDQFMAQRRSRPAPAPEHPAPDHPTPDQPAA